MVITSLDLIHIVTIIIKQKTISMLKIARPVSFLLLSAALCSSGTVFAANETATPKVGISQQQKSLKGTVNDVLGPVAGASVVVKGTTNGTVTDMDGNCESDGRYSETGRSRSCRLRYTKESEHDRGCCTD